ncbi:hypothetical protein BAUCODRAFT_121169 [Baudoinia panamericana UAMH 10762]|uniref:Uncharacterized protein n=1 Tax=Baudoinia panamericana (strain UAMH 10762) TaxID=717646 RepID=M2LUM1_BAUPA|nr:uncharacterized protein BAUCODRAFT_121169 [Baudoinia panamericana UAMH 10762]EMC98292.1 hypothetical protein BAUCODRAFT_121169 [Baudoinia panamericana UAMH 10762]
MWRLLVLYVVQVTFALRFSLYSSVSVTATHSFALGFSAKQMVVSLVPLLVGVAAQSSVTSLSALPSAVCELINCEVSQVQARSSATPFCFSFLGPQVVTSTVTSTTSTYGWLHILPTRRVLPIMKHRIISKTLAVSTATITPSTVTVTGTITSTITVCATPTTVNAKYKRSLPSSSSSSLSIPSPLKTIASSLISSACRCLSIPLSTTTCPLTISKTATPVTSVTAKTTLSAVTVTVTPKVTITSCSGSSSSRAPSSNGPSFTSSVRSSARTSASSSASLLGTQLGRNSSPGVSSSSPVVSSSPVISSLPVLSSSPVVSSLPGVSSSSPVVSSSSPVISSSPIVSTSSPVVSSSDDPSTSSTPTTASDPTLSTSSTSSTPSTASASSTHSTTSTSSTSSTSTTSSTSSSTVASPTPPPFSAAACQDISSCGGCYAYTMFFAGSGVTAQYTGIYDPFEECNPPDAPCLTLPDCASFGWDFFTMQYDTADNDWECFPMDPPEAGNCPYTIVNSARLSVYGFCRSKCVSLNHRR